MVTLHHRIECSEGGVKAKMEGMILGSTSLVVDGKEMLLQLPSVTEETFQHNVH